MKRGMMQPYVMQNLILDENTEDSIKTKQQHMEKEKGL